MTAPEEKTAKPKFKKGEFIVKSTLIQRGWTESLISNFLPEPDKLLPNPHYRKGPPMRLYSLVRVESAESRVDFLAAKEKCGTRKEAAKKAVATKTAKTMEYVEREVDAEVPLMSKSEVIKNACDSYNERIFWRCDGDFELATKKSPFLNRIAVNYLRHEMTDYDYHLDEIGGMVGKSAAYVAIRNKILDAIGRTYPWLLSECNRQKY